MQKHTKLVSRRDFLRTVGAGATMTALAMQRPNWGQEVINTDDEKLLDQWQQATLKFFTDQASSESGMALERSDWAAEPEYRGKAALATGATGFGIMSLIAGVKRGKESNDIEWPTEDAARDQIAKIVNFLDKKVPKYHGAFSHWIEPSGKNFVPPWRPEDNGGDLLETSFLIMGLLTAREYYKNDPNAEEMCKTIDKLWADVDWKWYTKNGEEKQLYWHWSEDKGWEMNCPINGWNEGLATYLLAASSPNEEHRISREVYEHGWAAPMKERGDGHDQYVTALQYQYSFAGIDPRGLKDAHVEKDCADYWEQGKKHLTAMYEYCKINPNNFIGYSGICWGLSECEGAPHSDPNKNRYQPRSRGKDDGTIATAAAPCSIIYLPDEALGAMRNFSKNEKIWDRCGPVDSFTMSDENGEPWYARTKSGTPIYIGIHQLPIGALIENHRSGLLWELFMNAPEVKNGLQNLGFESPYLNQERAITTPRTGAVR